jgi:hypothetical protein
MKWVGVTQWVRVDQTQVPPDERPARGSGGNSTCQPSHGSTKLEGTRTEAARASAASRGREHTGHKGRRAPPGLGEGQGEPHAPAMGPWPSERIIVPRVGSRGRLAGKGGEPLSRGTH